MSGLFGWLCYYHRLRSIYIFDQIQTNFPVWKLYLDKKQWTIWIKKE